MRKNEKTKILAFKKGYKMRAQHLNFYLEVEEHLYKVCGDFEQIYMDYSGRLTTWFVLLYELQSNEDFELCALVRDCIKMEQEETLFLLHTYRKDITQNDPVIIKLINDLPTRFYKLINIL